jgi:3-keto-disaccharide hydrolase
LVSDSSLAGWKAEPEYWKVEADGVLHGYTPGTEEHHYMYSEKSYGDFELHADVKLVGNNSGICIRLAPKNFDVVPGYQIDMGEGYWGCLWDEGRHLKVVDYPAEDAAKLVHADDWNHYYVRAEGHHIEAWLNGVKTIDVVDDQGYLSGPIGFQLCHGKGHATDASFKNIVCRPIHTIGDEQ